VCTPQSVLPPLCTSISASTNPPSLPQYFIFPERYLGQLYLRYLDRAAEGCLCMQLAGYPTGVRCLPLPRAGEERVVALASLGLVLLRGGGIAYIVPGVHRDVVSG
jgi:hypothetical protein